MLRLRRFASAEGVVAVPRRRQEHRRGVGHVDLRVLGVGSHHRKTTVGEGVEDRAGDRQGDPRTPALPDGRGAGLPVAGAFVALAVGRREPAHPAGHADRVEARQRALHPRRALDRPAPARQPAADPQSRRAARRGQLGDRRRARRGHDARRRFHRRCRSPRGPQGRQYHCGRNVRRHSQVRLHHGRLPDGPPADRDSRNAAQGHGREDRDPRGPGQQPQERHGGISAGQVHLRDGRQRFGQVDARQRDPAADSRQGALPLLRPAAGVRRGGGCRAHRQTGRRRPVAHRAHAAAIPRPIPMSFPTSASCSK